MAKTLQYAAQKWSRKTQAAEPKWARDVQGAPYCENFAKFLGHQAPEACQSWQAGIQAAISANAYAQGIQGKESKYIQGLENVA